MARKNKTNQITDQLTSVAAQTGIVLMAAAATLGVVEVTHPHEEKRAVLPAQPAYATVNTIEHAEHGSDNVMRREKEEVHPHQYGFSIAQRSAARAGRA